MRICRSKKDDMTKDGRKIHIKELCNSLSSCNIAGVIPRMRWVGHITCMNK